MAVIWSDAWSWFQFDSKSFLVSYKVLDWAVVVLEIQNPGKTKGLVGNRLENVEPAGLGNNWGRGRRGQCRKLIKNPLVLNPLYDPKL